MFRSSFLIGQLPSTLFSLLAWANHTARDVFLTRYCAVLLLIITRRGCEFMGQSQISYLNLNLNSHLNFNFCGISLSSSLSESLSLKKLTV